MTQITGVKFEDLNGDGVRQTGELGLADWVVFIDDNGNSELDLTERFTNTGLDGSYVIGGLQPGTYVVAEQSQVGWLQTAPGGASTQSVTVGAGATVSDIDFGNLQLGVASGVKFNDANEDGVPDDGEAGLGG